MYIVKYFVKVLISNKKATHENWFSWKACYNFFIFHFLIEPNFLCCNSLKTFKLNNFRTINNSDTGQFQDFFLFKLKVIIIANFFFYLCETYCKTENDRCKLLLLLLFFKRMFPWFFVKPLQPRNYSCNCL